MRAREAPHGAIHHADDPAVGAGAPDQVGDENNPRKTGKTDKQARVVWRRLPRALRRGERPQAALASDARAAARRGRHLQGDRRQGRRPDEAVRKPHRGFRSFAQDPQHLDAPVQGQSNIESSAYLQGDQRKYMVRCLKVHRAQEISWRHENPKTGEVTGMVWELDNNGQLDPESVRWLCAECAHPIRTTTRRVCSRQRTAHSGSRPPSPPTRTP
jgi:hypothetical protein